MLFTTVQMALRELRRNKMRSFLTMLGVVIGVGAVISLVTIGDGATASVTESISAMGKNLLMVQPGMRRGPGAPSTVGAPLDEGDAQAIAREISGARVVAPSASKGVLAVVGNKNWRTTVTGSTQAIMEARSYTVGSGRAMNDLDVQSGSPVALIGTTVARELYGESDPVGQSLRLGKVTLDVIGVLASKGTGMGTDNDDVVIMPLKAFQQRIAGNRDVTMIFVTVHEGRSTTSVKSQIEALLRERRRLKPEDDSDFHVRDMQEIIDAVGQTTSLLTMLLGAIAAVSLLVGGIGIMNIMLVSVTERTREIGIRLAIGALGKDVLRQFLIEAVVLSTIGGMIGVVLGLAGAFAAARYMDIAFLIAPDVVLLAFVFSGAVGVLFGYLPARKAANLNPIDALRHE
jgi:putative ABC transport system permease protein